jgi:hypothetical protein
MKKIYLASPVEPSGASWLINCFLELGIKVSHKPVVDNVWRQSDPRPAPEHMWQRASDGGYSLHPKAELLKKWLPALTRLESFLFREDIEIEYVQNFPTPQHVGQTVLFFVRDPRDALYSMYRRMRPSLTYEAFLRFPNPDTLFDRPTHWRLFVESWLALAGENCFHFEAYKQDATVLLQRVLGCLGLSYGADEIERAVFESSFEKAKAAEERYKMHFPGDWEVANRAGRVGDWVEQTEARTGSVLIESQAVDMMRRLGYACPADMRGVTPYSAACAQWLPIFKRICLPKSIAAPTTVDRLDDPSVVELLSFSEELDEALLRHTNLPNDQIRQLLDSLEHFLRASGKGTTEKIAQLRERFSEGSEHHFAQMRDLLTRRRQAKRQGA